MFKKKRERLLCSHWRSCAGYTVERKCDVCDVWMCKNCFPICPSCNTTTDTTLEMTIEQDDDPCECFKNPRPPCFAIKCISCSVTNDEYEWVCECSTWKCSGCDNKVCYKCNHQCRFCTSLKCCGCDKYFFLNETECDTCHKDLCEDCVYWEQDDDGEWSVPDVVQCPKCIKK